MSAESSSSSDSKASLVAQLKNAWNADAALIGSGSYYGEKWERCAENLVVMLGAGVSVGLVTSLVLFRSPRMRSLAVGVGAGCGIGSSWTTCRYKVYGEQSKRSHSLVNES